MILAGHACWKPDDTLDDAIPPDHQPVHIREERALAGTLFQIDILSADEAYGREAIQAAFEEVARAEAVLSEWDRSSEVSAVNLGAGTTAVRVSPELYGVLNRSLWFSEITEGAFDVTFAGCGRLWSIRERRIPDQDELSQCLRNVGFRKVVLDPSRSVVFLPSVGMRIGLGGIAKGYRVDRAAEILASRGISEYVVNGGGDIRVSGGRGEGPWEVTIAHPREPGGSLGQLKMSEGAIVTSGDSTWYFIKDGIRYHHILDPRTGHPARQSLAVTVIGDSAMDADALATGLFVMGPVRGLALVESLPGYEALIVDPDLGVHTSSGFPDIAPLLAADRKQPVQPRSLRNGDS
jgi:thiamine biosynthesis lipoprotein